MYTDDAVSKTDVERVKSEVTIAVNSAVSQIDAKQTEQIKKLRLFLAASAALNFFFTLVVFLSVR